MDDTRNPEGTVLNRARRVYRENGPVEVLRRGIPFAYEEYLRPRLPKRERVVAFNGIPARTGDVCVADRVVPWFEVPEYNSDDPEYEQPLIEALESAVSAGDEVVIVGGGWGVTAVVAARATGASGSVLVFEGAADRISDMEGTLTLNEIRDRVTVRHAIVGEPMTLTGAPSGADHLRPDELPECDVLELDCEGAEVGILSRLAIKPRVVVVETHRNEQQVRGELDRLGYEVVDRDVEKPGEIFILTARRRKE